MPLPATSAAAHSSNSSVPSTRGVFGDSITSREFLPCHSPNLYPCNSHMWEMLKKNKLYSKILSLMRVSKKVFRVLYYYLHQQKFHVHWPMGLLVLTRVCELKENISNAFLICGYYYETL
jgi:hypothetical protein